MNWKALTLLLATVAVSGLGGCATPRLAPPTFAPGAFSEARERMRSPVPTSRRTGASDQIALINRIDRRIMPATIRVCQRTFNNPEACPGQLRRRTLEVRVNDAGINAFVGTNYDVLLLGGLISHAGSDDEIAAVLAHEYSHALLAHPRKSERNRLGGMLIGAAIGAAIGAKTDNPEWVNLGVRVGFETGNLMFSRSMELEADHLGMFILHEAGYDLRRATDFHVRMMHYAARGATVGVKGLLGFIATHPPPERRIDNMIATQQLIEAGARRPAWKKK